jgi:DNA-binding MarR family transcriptional regulator
MLPWKYLLPWKQTISHDVMRCQSLAISGLDSHIGYWLRFVSNHVSHAFARKLEGRDVTVAEWAALRELYDVEGIAPIRVAERLGMTRGAISKLAERLITKSLARRKPDPTDSFSSLAVSQQGGEQKKTVENPRSTAA